jgi:hypothetical protein
LGGHGVPDDRTLTSNDDSWSHQDFWLFDEQTAVLLRDDEGGHFLGVKQADNTAPYLDAKQAALTRSIDFKDFSLETTSLER